MFWIDLSLIYYYCYSCYFYGKQWHLLKLSNKHCTITIRQKVNVVKHLFYWVHVLSLCFPHFGHYTNQLCKYESPKPSGEVTSRKVRKWTLKIHKRSSKFLANIGPAWRITSRFYFYWNMKHFLTVEYTQQQTVKSKEKCLCSVWCNNVVRHLLWTHKTQITA